MRIVLALERAPESAAALEPALALAQSLGAAMCALFVESPGLLGYAMLPFAKEIDPDSGEARSMNLGALERAMRAEAERAEKLLSEAARQHSVAFSFRVTRGQIDVEARTERKVGDIAMLGIFGGATRWASDAPTNPGSGLVAAYCAPGASTGRVLDTAARVSEASRHRLAIAAPEDTRAEVEALLPTDRAAARMVWLEDGGIAAFLRALARFPVSTYVVSDSFAHDVRRARPVFRGGRNYLLVLVP